MSNDFTRYGAACVAALSWRSGADEGADAACATGDTASAAAKATLVVHKAHSQGSVFARLLFRARCVNQPWRAARAGRAATVQMSKISSQFVGGGFFRSGAAHRQRPESIATRKAAPAYESLIDKP